MIVLTAGNFGAAVGARLAATHGAEVLPLTREAQSLRSIVGRAEFLAVAAWRPYVQIYRAIDDLCFEAGKPWSIAEIHGERLSCGPLIHPGAGPCYHCYRQRVLSHHRAPDWELVLEHWYQRDDSVGPHGYASPLVAIAAGALASDAAARPNEAGRLRCVDVLTGAVLETEVIGVHGCPRCRRAAGEARAARFIQKLVPAVEAILDGGAPLPSVKPMRDSLRTDSSAQAQQ